MYDPTTNPRGANPNRGLRVLAIIALVIAGIAFAIAAFLYMGVVAFGVGKKLAPFLLGGVVLWAIVKWAESVSPADTRDDTGK